MPRFIRSPFGLIGSLAITLALATSALCQDSPDVRVFLIPHPIPQKHALARVKKIGIGGEAGRSLRLEIENIGDANIVELTISYEVMSCAAGKVSYWVTTGKEPLNDPAAHSVILPAHTIRTFEDNDAWVIANWALHNGTRFMEGSAEVVGAVLEDGSTIQWKDVVAPKGNSMAFHLSACAEWPWTNKEATGAAIWPPEPGPTASEETADGAGVTYTCRVVDGLIHCPRR